MRNRPNILTIAGFDPSAGAGILADVKTAEQLKCYAYAVQTSNTIQTADTFESVNWIDEAVYFNQLETTLKSASFNAIKIGLIRFDWLSKTSDLIQEFAPKSFVIWDPILKASAGFDFEQSSDLSFLKNIDLITPNWDEISFFGTGAPIEIAKSVASEVNVYLKGGHSEELGKDYLFAQDKSFTLNPKAGKFSEKHGSGCILSSAIASYVAREFPLLKSCYRAKRYVEDRLSSNASKLAYHK